MSTRRAAWHVDGGNLRRLAPGGPGLEAELEDWIEADPSLVGGGMKIVGRQVHVDGGVIDLLGVDPLGRWVVIEVKKATLRRAAVAQALDYASSLAAMAADDLLEVVATYLGERGEREPAKTAAALLQGDEDGREVAIAVVGTAVDPGLLRTTTYLTDHSHIAIDVVTLDAFETDTGLVLLREVDETEPEPEGTSHSMLTVDELVAGARRAGIGTSFESLLRAADRNGLYPRPYKKAIMCTPDGNRSRLLYVFQNVATEDGLLRVYPYAPAFAEFFPLTEAEVEDRLGPSEWQDVDVAGARTFAKGVDELMRLAQTRDDME